MSARHVELARRLRAGDRAVLGAIAEEFSSSVSAWLARKYGGRLPSAEIEGVMQETLLIVWLKREKVAVERDTLRAWFATIANNVARQHLRNGLVKAHLREDLPPTGELDLLAWNRREIRRPQCVDEADGDAAPSSDLCPRRRFRAERLPIMAEILGLLTEGERAALLATHGDGSPISHAEAAARLGVNPGTFRSRLKRARKKIEQECARRGLPAPNWRRWDGNIGERNGDGPP